MPDYRDAERTPLEAIEDHDRYRLYRQADIVQVLKQLARRPEIVTAYFDGGESYTLTAVVAVEPEAGRLVLDAGPDPVVNRKLLRADKVICVAKQNKVDVRFECGGLTESEYEGYPAFIAALPESLLRLQRREFFRVPTLVSSPVTLEVAGAGTFQVVDISIGGLGVLDTAAKLEVGLGELLPRCQLEIPEFGRFEVELEVRNLASVGGRPGQAPGRRIGCAFGRLSRDKENLIQRYLNQLQLRARALERS